MRRTHRSTSLAMVGAPHLTTARSLDAGQRGGPALLLLASHVVAEGDLGAEFLRGLACGVKRPPETSLDVLHLNFEFAAKCLSQRQNVLVLRQKPHTAPHRLPGKREGATVIVTNATNEV